MISIFSYTTFADWVEENGTWRYIYENGEYARDELLQGKNGLYYYVDFNGEIVRNAEIEIDGKTRYFNDAGEMQDYGDNITIDTIKSSKGWVEEDGNWKYIENDGSYATDIFKKSNNNTYYLDSDGNMVTDYIYDDDNNTYYFSETGAMVTHLWVAFEPERFDFDKWDAEYYYMYFQDNGKAVKGKKGEGKKKIIDGKTYIFDEDGVMLTGWISGHGEKMESENLDDWYSADAKYYAYEDGSLAEGWLRYEDTNRDGDKDVGNIDGDLLDLDVMYFYFKPSDHVKVEGKEMKINGEKYRFEKDTGRMYMQWEETEKLLPYWELEYIDSDGSNVINTGVVPKLNIIREQDCQVFSGLEGYMRNNGNGYIRISSSYYTYHKTNNRPLSPPRDRVDFTPGRHVIYFSQGVQKVDGVAKSYNSLNDTFNDNWKIYFFGCLLNAGNDSRANPDAGFTSHAVERLWSCKIWRGDKLIRDYVPAKMKINVINAYGRQSYRGDIGLWDKVDKKFYPQEHGNNLIPGPAKYEYKHNGIDEDGSLAKHEWVYDVPSVLMSEEKYENQESEWFLANANGILCIDEEKKINNKTYLFDKDGIMQKSLIIKYNPNDKIVPSYRTNYYILRVDLDSTDATDFIKKGVFYLKDKPVPYDSNVNTVVPGQDPMYRENCIKMVYQGNKMPYNIFYFGDDGAKRTGYNIKVDFGEEQHVFASKDDGAVYGIHGDKYYSNGFLCAADKDIGYGILVDYNIFDYSQVGNHTVATKFRTIDPMFLIIIIL